MRVTYWRHLWWWWSVRLLRSTRWNTWWWEFGTTNLCPWQWTFTINWPIRAATDQVLFEWFATTARSVKASATTRHQRPTELEFTTSQWPQCWARGKHGRSKFTLSAEPRRPRDWQRESRYRQATKEEDNSGLETTILHKSCLQWSNHPIPSRGIEFLLWLWLQSLEMTAL